MLCVTFHAARLGIRLFTGSSWPASNPYFCPLLPCIEGPLDAAGLRRPPEDALVSVVW